MRLVISLRMAVAIAAASSWLSCSSGGGAGQGQGQGRGSTGAWRGAGSQGRTGPSRAEQEAGPGLPSPPASQLPLLVPSSCLMRLKPLYQPLPQPFVHHTPAPALFNDQRYRSVTTHPPAGPPPPRVYYPMRILHSSVLPTCRSSTISEATLMAVSREMSNSNSTVRTWPAPGSAAQRAGRPVGIAGPCGRRWSHAPMGCSALPAACYRGLGNTGGWRAGGQGCREAGFSGQAGCGGARSANPPLGSQMRRRSEKVSLSSWYLPTCRGGGSARED